jgi:nucleotide-binding universal stress UspA family protein
MATSTITTVFDRVVCGVDASEAGTSAARAAALLTAREGRLSFLAVNDPSIAVHAGWAMSQVLEELAEEARAALDHARAEADPLHSFEAKLVDGDPRFSLLAEIERCDATLVVVGSHGLSRAAGIALGAVSTHLLHEAPCSVLIVRGEIDVNRWPRRIVVGVDGSPDSDLALGVGRALADRFDADVRAVTATQDVHIDLDAARKLAPRLEEHDGRALQVLTAAAETSDLVVVGSRGLRGVRALGSLSERLAHDAGQPVLVVRTRGEQAA